LAPGVCTPGDSPPRHWGKDTGLSASLRTQEIVHSSATVANWHFLQSDSRFTQAVSTDSFNSPDTDLSFEDWLEAIKLENNLPRGDGEKITT
jgi:hypothetical protein